MTKAHSFLDLKDPNEVEAEIISAITSFFKLDGTRPFKFRTECCIPSDEERKEGKTRKAHIKLTLLKDIKLFNYVHIWYKDTEDFIDIKVEDSLTDSPDSDIVNILIEYNGLFSSIDPVLSKLLHGYIGPMINKLLVYEYKEELKRLGIDE
jgi:hypothetical protein